ncbi:hypothetical protein AC578_10515 [Pseudocercospora eumusae]|uniref:PhoD-like phosphatase metallophosphatase domain-containing protein n=1 Tax=Pseudocercospora eumusae TaxID=321146 RepID=A0A139GV83_9PEZI|nr:hypothetical protein AC578_10515 [Pseudocercospora eumusae]
MMSSTGVYDVAWYTTAISSILLRTSAFIFLRWIPGHHFPPVIYSLFAIYLPSFWYTLVNTAPFEVVADILRVETRDAVPEDVLDVDARYANGNADPGKELVVEEEIDLVERDPRTLRTLMTGLPSPTSNLWSIMTLLLNAALVLMSFDLVNRATFLYPSHDLSMARVGYVSDRTASIVFREPEAARLPIYASYRYADAPLAGGVVVDTSWKAAGEVGWVDERTDFTGTFEITGLKPDTRYQWTVNNETGFFTTAPRIGQVSTRAENHNTFTFVHSSCIKLNFPYNPLSHPLSAPGLRHLSDALKGLKAQFMLFLGDFIYIDVPGGQGRTLEDYRRNYRQVYASPDWPDAAKELPWIHVYDDHEIQNDWDGNTTSVFPAANDPYEHYHISANPPAVRKGETYFSFTQGPATFFMLDTRRYRSPNDNTNGSDPITGDPTKTMLGAQQLSDLLAWLQRPEPQGVKWKILVSSVPFTKNWWFGAQDTWRGYLGERQIILEAMWDVGLKGGIGVVILSGDRHEFAATAFPPPPPNGKEEIIGLGPIGVGAQPLAGFAPDTALLTPDAKSSLRTKRKRWPLSATVHEFSVSPLSMFYLPVRTYTESSTSEEYLSDVCIKYIPDGNSKFGAVSISNPVTSDQSILNYKLFVDGVETWSYMITTTTPPDLKGGG